MPEITYQYKDCYELQLIDANCNNCLHMQRNMEKFKYWEDKHKGVAERDFYEAKGSAILDAGKVIDNAKNENELRSGKGMLRVADKMKFQFEKKYLLQYARCLKYDKDISFIPNTCQIETQHCFKHRKDGQVLQNS